MKTKDGRGGQIRTDDFLLPKQALYQAELRPAARGPGDDPRSAGVKQGASGGARLAPLGPVVPPRPLGARPAGRGAPRPRAQDGQVSL